MLAWHHLSSCDLVFLFLPSSTKDKSLAQFSAKITLKDVEPSHCIAPLQHSVSFYLLKYTFLPDTRIDGPVSRGFHRCNGILPSRNVVKSSSAWAGLKEEGRVDEVEV